MSMEPDGSMMPGTLEPEVLDPEEKLEMEPKESAPVQSPIPFQADDEASETTTTETPPQDGLAADAADTVASAAIPVAAKQKGKKDKAAKPSKTATRLKADPLAKTKMQVKEKAKEKSVKSKEPKYQLPFYFLLPHMCTLFSIVMLLITMVSFYGFHSSVGVFFLFPIWPLGLLLFAALMFFTPLRDPMAPRGVNFFIKLNLVYNIIMLAVSIVTVLTSYQNITLWGFVWLAGGFIIPLIIMFLNRRFMR